MEGTSPYHVVYDEERLEDDLDARFAQVSSEGRAEVRDGRIVGLGDGDDGALSRKE
jgi:hypothetical protein